VGRHWERAIFLNYAYRTMPTWTRVNDENVREVSRLGSVGACSNTLQRQQVCIGGFVRVDSDQREVVYGFGEMRRVR
jgi:hypothetical protein